MHTNTHAYIIGVYICIYIYLNVDYNYNTPIRNTKFAEVTVSSIHSLLRSFTSAARNPLRNTGRVYIPPAAPHCHRNQ